MAGIDALIMPSAVAPPVSTPFQALTDPSIRLNQTLRAIDYWVNVAEKRHFRILVADNTQFATAIKKSLSKKARKSRFLEIIDVPPVSDFDTSRGKGAGETSTLRRALEHLNLHNDAIVAKVNARYITTNGIYLLDEIDNIFDFAAWPRPLLDSVDTTFFAGKVKFLREAFEFVYENTDDLKEDFVENLYADFSIRNPTCRFVRFNYCPATKGQSGTTGTNASPLNEFRMVSLLLRIRKRMRNYFSFLKPKYQRGSK